MIKNDKLTPYICEDCIYSDLYDWEQNAKTGKATPKYWCEKLKKIADKTADEFCDDFIDENDEGWE